MKTEQYVLALDQGTTSSRAVLFSSTGAAVGMAQKEFAQIYPAPGLVEHDPEQIWQSQLYAMKQAVLVAGVSPQHIAAIGITNQRETTLAWNAATGVPICNAIVWQCRRTAPICEQLKQAGLAPYIQKITGLVVDPYFSGTKMRWILDNVPQAAQLAKKGLLRFGTVDTWLIYKLTEGKTYVTDVSNAGRTMLFDIHRLCWDAQMLKTLHIPLSALPKVVESSGTVGVCAASVLGCAIPIAGVAGDQHAALFGQCCFRSGMTKNTYGTGCFVLMNTGETPVHSKNGLLTTIAWQVGGKVSYALEGSAFHAGSAIQWLRDELQMIVTPREADDLAESVPDTGGVTFVPAFTGLGAPHWDMYARAALLGVTRGTGRAQIARAVLESIALESLDIFTLMEQESGVRICALRVDGGASRSRFLMQYQADLLGRTVQRPVCLETTAMGAAMLAGLGVGVWKSLEDVGKLWTYDTVFTPQGDLEGVRRDTQRWHRAVKACRLYGEESLC